MRVRYGWLMMSLALAPGAAVWSAPSDSRQVVLPADTVLKVKLDDTIGSDRSQRGDKFIATVQDPKLPDGTIVRGVVSRSTAGPRAWIRRACRLPVMAGSW